MWIGYDDNDQLGLTGAEAALPAWSEFIKEAVTLRPELGSRNFECPEGIKFVEIDSDHGAISTVSCPHRELIAVTDRLAPNLECYLHADFPDESGTAQPTTTPINISPSLTVANKTPQVPNRLRTRVERNSHGRIALSNDLR